jgi:hypothetical protein
VLCPKCGLDKEDSEFFKTKLGFPYTPCRKCRLSYATKYHKEHRKQINLYSVKHNLELKKEILTYYGNGKCACVHCGYSDIRALSIDHISGEGRKHRRELGYIGGIIFYYWLKRNNFPEGYQTLCMNCQWIKRRENGEDNRWK